MTQAWANVLALASGLATAVICYGVGRWQGRMDREGEADRGHRYAMAVDQIRQWCGAVSPHARLIAEHLIAKVEGPGLNAGTPVGDEPCTINGLREQLRRLDAGR